MGASSAMEIRMPHENIASTDPQMRARVTWRSDPDGDGHVQVATLREPQITYTSTGDRGTSVTANPSSPSIMSTTEQDSGWYVDLSREQINRLIRVLRRARDAAFGSDA
jgi:hypothetical protein